MRAWSFLISASPFRDYAPIVVPDFIKEAGAVREVIRAAGGFDTGPGEAIYFKGYREGVGVVDMVFRVVDGTAKMLGQDSNEVLRDKQGRTIRLIEGFVLRERSGDAQLEFTQGQLDAAHNAVEDDFRRFWNAEHHWESVASTSVELSPEIGVKLRLQFKESPSLPRVPAVPPPLVAKSSAPSREGDVPPLLPGPERGPVEHHRDPLAQKKTPDTISGDDSAKMAPAIKNPSSSPFLKHLSGGEYVGGALITAGIIFLAVLAGTGFFGILMKMAGIAAIVFGAIYVIRALVRR